MTKCMNGKELRTALGISSTLFYKWKKSGMPYHKLPNTRAYYFLDEVEKWMKTVGYHQEQIWTK